MVVAVMTIRLSPYKVSKILRGYFRGLPQTRIARAAGIDQSSVSHYAFRFKETANKYGLPAAGKEYQVLNEVESLRSLSVELYQSKLTVEEARQGHEIIKAFLKLGINPEQHLNLVDVCKRVEDPGFTEAAIKLYKIETQTGMGYHQIISGFEAAQIQIPRLNEKIAEAKADLKSTNDSLMENKKKLTSQEVYLKKRRNEVKTKEAQLDKELSTKMKQLEVAKKEVEEVATLKADLTQKGLNIDTLLKLAKEF
jgi:predicted transcriptional regulator